MYSNAMHLRKTFDRKNFIRLENVEGDSITAYIDGKEAHILSILVSFPNRGMARGTELVTALEGYLFKRGVKRLSAIYSSELLNVCDLLSVCDFSIVEGDPLKVCNALEVLSEHKVSIAISRGKDNDLFIPLSDLNPVQTSKLMYLLKKYFKPLSMSYVLGFSQELSGVIFDDRGMIATAIFCTRYESGVHIDYFIKPSNEGVQYIKPLISGFLYRLATAYNKEPFENITYINMNPAIEKIISSYLEYYTGEKTALSFIADKDLKKIDNDIEIRDVGSLPEDVFMRTWQEEVSSIPYQNNIYVKRFV